MASVPPGSLGRWCAACRQPRLLRELWRGAGVSAVEPVAWEYPLASRYPAVAHGGGADLTPCPVVERPVRRG